MIKKLQEISIKNLEQRGINFDEIDLQEQAGKIFEEIDEFENVLTNYMVAYLTENKNRMDILKSEVEQEAIDVIRAILSFFDKAGFDVRGAWKRNFEIQRERGN